LYKFRSKLILHKIKVGKIQLGQTVLLSTRNLVQLFLVEASISYLFRKWYLLKLIARVQNLKFTSDKF